MRGQIFRPEISLDLDDPCPADNAADSANHDHSQKAMSYFDRRAIEE
jgi:hypothetical protein